MSIYTIILREAKSWLDLPPTPVMMKKYQQVDVLLNV